VTQIVKDYFSLLLVNFSFRVELFPAVPKLLIRFYRLEIFSIVAAPSESYVPCVLTNESFRIVNCSLLSRSKAAKLCSSEAIAITIGL
jgi:hypothetical protein